MVSVDEKINILDGAGNPTGEVLWKSEAHRRGLWHRCFHCWISGEDEEGSFLLVQRRAPQKDTFPGCLDVTCAGHLRSGEGVIEAGLRELSEELGVRVAPRDLVRLGTRRIEQEIPGGMDRELHEVFLLPEGLSPWTMSLQREEVSAVYRLPLDGIDHLLAGERVGARFWGPNGSGRETVALEEFVPNEDGYLARVVRAVRAALGGYADPGAVFREETAC